ncbi:hypothetical protein N6L24_14740 [Cognatishimia sp. SS12]|uniref:hypothetical protein n=1 Tax=Cognatishimia sp. SS12 TaxID=2979465 RepID=UPI00232E0BFF|nr:hypothetical protein [Cognatishimia sp. SS12]MDC0739544.1 hypothetical protein [Cognatishimia sp. SS12]
MLLTLALTTVAIPLVLGVFLACGVQFTSAKAALLALFASVLILVVYYLLEGVPPFPPISSKHKLAYLLILIGVVGFGFGAMKNAPKTLIALVVGLVALGWIAQRKIASDPFQPELFLALLPVLGLTGNTALRAELRQDLFLWPIMTLALAIAGAIVSVLGGYIGLAQMLGACAALTGGYLALTYLRVAVLGKAVDAGKAAALNWVLLASVSIILLSIAVFASKLSSLAFVLLCLLYAIPFVAARFAGRMNWKAPIATGGYAVVPALAAIATAWLTAA